MQGTKFFLKYKWRKARLEKGINPLDNEASHDRKGILGTTWVSYQHVRRIPLYGLGKRRKEARKLGLDIIRVLEADTRLKSEVDQLLFTFEYKVGGSLAYGQEAALFKAMRYESECVMKILPIDYKGNEVTTRNILKERKATWSCCRISSQLQSENFYIHIYPHYPLNLS